MNSALRLLIWMQLVGWFRFAGRGKMQMPQDDPELERA